MPRAIRFQYSNEYIPSFFFIFFARPRKLIPYPLLHFTQHPFFSAVFSQDFLLTPVPTPAGSAIVLDGFGFDFTGAFGYYCQFSVVTPAGTISVDSKPATPRNSRSVTCTSPAWGSLYAATTTSVTLRKANSFFDVLVSGVSGASDVFSFSFWQQWVSLSPNSASAAGGSVLTVIGSGCFRLRQEFHFAVFFFGVFSASRPPPHFFTGMHCNFLLHFHVVLRDLRTAPVGFDTSQNSYLCRLKNPSNSDLLNSARVTPVSSTVILCTLPSWGSKFAALPVIVQLFQSDSLVTPAAQTAPTLTMIELVSTVLNPVLVTQPIRLAFGGFGFSSTTPYICVFSNPTGTMTTVAIVASTVLLFCPLATWDQVYGAGQVQITVNYPRDGAHFSPFDFTDFSKVYHFFD